MEQYRALHEAAGYMRRVDRGRIFLRGEDRKSYLQGLLSNDILALRSGEACYATLLTPQGRMISDMRVFDLGDLILLDLELAVTPPVTAHLEKFVIAEDVTVENATETHAQIGIYGPRAAGLAAAIRDQGWGFTLHAVPSDDIGIAGVELVVPGDQVDALEASLLEAGAVRIDPATADVTRVEAGIPRFLADMDATTIPLEAGIESRAISMSKGCYVGQEVIVRVLHRGGGRVARRLVGLVTDARVERGDPVLAEGRELGKVTSAVDAPRLGRRIALAYVHRDHAEPGSTLEARGAPATVVSLPFAAGKAG